MKCKNLNIEQEKNSTSKESSNAQYLKLKKCIESMNSESKFKFWIKTLISSFGTIPEIINSVDKIIEIQASKVSFASDIFNKNQSTYSQLEGVIDLTERKNSLLNIYIMTKNMLEQLTFENYDLLERRFIYNWSNDELSKYYEVSIRTIYRKIDKIIDIIYDYCLKKKWTLKFIYSQLKNEGWLKERYLKFVKDYFKNSNYKTLCEDETQSKSSSEL